MDLLEATRRTEWLTAVATAHCHNAQDLCRIASSLRGRISSEVRRNPYRRSLRLARGASDGTPTVDQSKETTERRCPYCQDDAIKPLGRVQIEAGVVRSAYCCTSCDRAFAYVRRALG
jgi:hypothetical protein